GAGTAPGDPRSPSEPHAPADPHDPDRPVVLQSVDLKAAEAKLIQRALERTGQNRTRAAELLGISVRTLRNRLNRD
ncbi:MAG TPA: helix-turn-helix domain-containing protein, partial [Longimicrobiales bacterium]|nr:helix-turn-helix domain-containing protein [Longimicrobiales bacterium]